MQQFLLRYHTRVHSHGRHALQLEKLSDLHHATLLNRPEATPAGAGSCETGSAAAERMALDTVAINDGIRSVWVDAELPHETQDTLDFLSGHLGRGPLGGLAH